MKTLKKAIICFQIFTLLFVVRPDQGHSSEQAVVDGRFEVSSKESKYVVFSDRPDRTEAHVIRLLPEFISRCFAFAIIRHESMATYRSFTASFLLTNIYFVALSALAP